MTVLGHALGYGIVTAVLIALSAAAFSLQYSVSSVPNFAHGDLLTIGAYGALVGQRLGLPLPLDAVVGAIVGAVGASLIYRLVLHYFTKQGTRLVFTVAVTAGVALIIENSLSIIFGNSNVNLTVSGTGSHQIGPFLWTNIDLIILVAGGLLLALLFMGLRYTQFGRSVRAVSDNRDLARASGIRVERTVLLTWAVAGLVAGLAGVALATSQSNFGPFIGSNFLLVTFSAAIIGGVGRINGAVLGALIIGLVTEISGAYFNAGYKQVAAMAILVIVLLVRPNGLLNVQRAGAEA
jgi:branched-subunit amino acid ABC-type transport system permease component